MCGIAGWYNPAPTASWGSRLEPMVRLLHHRGPDACGYHRDAGIELGMRRLSVIDPVGSPQPVKNEDETIVAICNGEIYNYRDLRTSLCHRGHRFRTGGDTETLVHLYEEHGCDFVHHLQGMFAIALWDSEKRKLVLARDRLGIKPLHYAQVADHTIFSSELGSLLAGLDGRPAIDRVALMQYLAFGYIPAPRTIFAGVHKLLPGHFLVLEGGRTRLHQYWDVPIEEDGDISFEHATIRLQELLTDAVASHLVSDVPLGALLSGGIDSSAIVAIASSMSDTPVETFSVGFNERAYDELAFAQTVADHCRTRHYAFSATPDVVEQLPELIQFHGEPFGDASSVPTSIVSKMARTRVTVALSGDGGDELFAGYTRYQVERRRGWIDHIPAAFRRHTLGALARFLPPGAHGVNLLDALARDHRGRYLKNISTILDPARGGIASAELFREVHWEELAAPFLAEFYRVRHRDPVTQLAYVDLKTYLPDDILTKVDRMSMAHSLETRPPLLDHPLVEFAMSLPIGFKMQNGTTKRILRQAVGHLLPNAVLDRGKQGFGMPLLPWFKTDLRSLLDEIGDWQSSLSELLDRDGMRRIVREHSRGRRDHSTALWKIVTLMQWERALMSNSFV